MGHIIVRVEGLDTILERYIGPSLYLQAYFDILQYIKENLSVVVHIDRQMQEADITMIPGDTLTLSHHFDIVMSIEQLPVEIEEVNKE